MNDDVKLSPEERLLFIINDNTINGSTRFQKYGFLLCKQYRKDLAKLKTSYREFSFYDDWEPYHYGPYSKKLSGDIQTCVDRGILKETAVDQNPNHKKYELTTKGRSIWRKLFNNTPTEIIRLNDKIRYLQLASLEQILKQIYDAYPEFTVRGKTKGGLG